MVVSAAPALAGLEAFLPQGETAKHTPLQAARDGLWQRSEAPPRISGDIEPKDGMLTVSAGQQATINVEWVLAGSNRFSGQRLQVRVQDGATLELLETIKGDGWAADTIELELGKGARATHAVVQQAAGVVTRRENIGLANEAYYRRLALQAGSKLARLELTLTLESSAEVALTGINLCGDATGRESVLDQTTLLALNGPGNRCNVQQRNVVNKHGRAVFQGKYFVAKEAQQTDGYMLVKNLLLDDSAQAFAKPELEIYADNVKCSHGASTGGINPEQLFYMESRGIDAAAARRLIVAGFAGELLEGWEGDMRATAQGVTDNWLAGS